MYMEILVLNIRVLQHFSHYSFATPYLDCQYLMDHRANCSPFIDTVVYHGLWFDRTVVVVSRLTEKHVPEKMCMYSTLVEKKSSGVPL